MRIFEGWWDQGIGIHVLQHATHAHMGASRHSPVACASSERFYHCFGWFEKFDTKFVPISALMIYSVTTLDVAAHTNGGAKTSYAAAAPRVGHLGASMWWLLCCEPFVTLGNWGLPIFLWQTATNVLTQQLLIDLGWGLTNRCPGHGLKFSFEYAAFYWVSLSLLLISHPLCPSPPVCRLSVCLSPPRPLALDQLPCYPSHVFPLLPAASCMRSPISHSCPRLLLQWFHVFVAYFVAWLMNDDGPIGSLIHNAVKKITPA